MIKTGDQNKKVAQNSPILRNKTKQNTNTFFYSHRSAIMTTYIFGQNHLMIIALWSCY